MTGVPDLLLPQAAETRARPAAAKAESTRNDGTSSFADVYSRERAAPADSKAPNAPVEDKNASASAESQDSDEASVAENGNLLPDLEAMLGLGLANDPVEDGSEPQNLAATNALLVATDDTLVPAFSFAQMGFKPAELEIDPQVKSLNSVQTAQPLLALAANADAEGEAELAQVSETALTKASKEGVGEVLEQGLKLESLTGKAAAEPSSGQSSVEPAHKFTQVAQAVAAVSQAQRAQTAPGQPVAMQQAGWSEAVVDRVMWLSSQNLKSAEIQLDPAELGRLDVRVNLVGDQTQVTFASAHAGVREALESQMHRLRDMFAQQGLSQPQVNVSDHSAQSGREQQSGQGTGRGMGQASDEDEMLSGVSRMGGAGHVSKGLVDYYA